MSELLNKILVERSSETFNTLERKVLPSHLHKLFDYLKSLDNLPSLDELVTLTERSTLHEVVLSLIEVEDTDSELDFLIEHAKNKFAQDYYLDLLSHRLAEVPLMSATKLVELSQSIALELAEELNIEDASEDALESLTFSDEEITKINLGLNPVFDQEVGFLIGQLVLVAAEIGKGKSHVAVNAVANQFRLGKPSLLFNIEQSPEEVYSRLIANLSGVGSVKILTNKMDREEKFKVAKVLRSFYENSLEVYDTFVETEDLTVFRTSGLTKVAHLPHIVCGPVGIPDISRIISKYRIIHKDALQVVCVDYLNRITSTDPDGLGWKSQIGLANNLKDIATDNQVTLLTMSQAKESGELKLSKDILIPIDWAWFLKEQKGGGIVSFKCLKVRSGASVGFNTSIDWDRSRLLEDVNTENVIISPDTKTNEEDLPF